MVDELKLAAERYSQHLAAEAAETPSDSPYYASYGAGYAAWFWKASMRSDEATIARGAARILSGMPELGDLPAGPFSYMDRHPHADWGTVFGADGFPVANTCPGMFGEEFSKAHPAYGDVRKAGPPASRATAELLIWARGVVEISKQQSAAAGE